MPSVAFRKSARYVLNASAARDLRWTGFFAGAQNDILFGCFGSSIAEAGLCGTIPL